MNKNKLFYTIFLLKKINKYVIRKKYYDEVFLIKNNLKNTLLLEINDIIEILKVLNIKLYINTRFIIL